MMPTSGMKGNSVAVSSPSGTGSPCNQCASTPPAIGVEDTGKQRKLEAKPVVQLGVARGAPQMPQISPNPSHRACREITNQRYIISLKPRCPVTRPQTSPSLSLSLSRCIACRNLKPSYKTRKRQLDGLAQLWHELICLIGVAETPCDTDMKNPSLITIDKLGILMDNNQIISLSR